MDSAESTTFQASTIIPEPVWQSQPGRMQGQTQDSQMWNEEEISSLLAISSKKRGHSRSTSTGTRQVKKRRRAISPIEYEYEEEAMTSYTSGYDGDGSFQSESDDEDAAMSEVEDVLGADPVPITELERRFILDTYLHAKAEYDNQRALAKELKRQLNSTQTELAKTEQTRQFVEALLPQQMNKLQVERQRFASAVDKLPAAKEMVLQVLGCLQKMGIPAPCSALKCRLPRDLALPEDEYLRSFFEHEPTQDGAEDEYEGEGGEDSEEDGSMSESSAYDGIHPFWPQHEDQLYGEHMEQYQRTVSFN